MTFASQKPGDADSMAEMPESPLRGSGRNPREIGRGASREATSGGEEPLEARVLMEAVVERENMKRAMRRVVGNGGGAGVDGMSVEELRPYLKEKWPQIKEKLLGGRYQPRPVRKVEIPKAGGGVRMLGIPTVVDRLIQQAMHQVLTPVFEEGFSESSYGFRPRRSAHQAVERAREYVAEGRRWVVDIDLEKFFDRVNHDMLMTRVARKVKDKRVLGLIRRYLQSGIMAGGMMEVRREGTPQGGPLSPLLSNVMLDDLDRELTRRGHRYCRYADDCNIYVRSKAAGERVLESIREFLESKLKLKVNAEKSAVDRPWRRKFLGYSMTFHSRPLLKAAGESVKRLKNRLREIFRSGRGRNLKRVIEEITPIIRGWAGYFRLAEVKGIFEELDSWIRRKLRCILWRQWKKPSTRAKRLMKRGVREARAYLSAFNGRGAWWNSGASHMNDAYRKRFFDRLGLTSLLQEIHRLNHPSRTAVYGTVRTVV